MCCLLSQACPDDHICNWTLSISFLLPTSALPSSLLRSVFLTYYIFTSLFCFVFVHTYPDEKVKSWEVLCCSLLDPQCLEQYPVHSTHSAICQIHEQVAKSLPVGGFGAGSWGRVETYLYLTLVTPFYLSYLPFTFLLPLKSHCHWWFSFSGPSRFSHLFSAV